MKTHQFVLAHFYAARSPLANLIGVIRKDCLKISPTARCPKLGDHTTILPPFNAPVDEMAKFSVALGLAKVLYGTEQSYRNEAKIVSMDYFRNPGVDALILRISPSREYKAFVMRCRKHIEKFNEWKFDLPESTFNPHACIAEEENLWQKLRPHGKIFQKHFHPVHFHLPSPQIMIKIKDEKGTRWEEFDPDKEY